MSRITRLLHPTMLIAAVLAAPLAASVPCNAAAAPDFGELVRIASRHGLPMPPPNARLVLAYTGYNGMLGSESTSRDPGIYSPAYLLEERKDGSIVVLRGSEEEIMPYTGDVPYRSFSTAHVTRETGGYIVDFARLSTFVCAVQAAAAGKDDIAESIWIRFSASDFWIDDRDHSENAVQQIADPGTLLARCIFDHLRGGLLKEHSDWQDIHTRMVALLSEFPKLSTPERQSLSDDLAASLNAAPTSPRSVEALLLDWSRRPAVRYSLDWIFLDCEPGDANSPARDIVLQWHDSVPHLLSMLDDRRVTAHESPGFNNFLPHTKRLGELAGELVRAIGGDRIPYAWPVGMSDEDKGAMKAWWEEVRARDEAASLCDAAFTRESGKIVGVNEVPVYILAHKYPTRLRGLCAEFSKSAKPDVQPFLLAGAIVSGRLPAEDRVRLLSDFAARGSLVHRRSVLQALADLDPKVCARLLLPLLRTLPTDADGTYWNCPQVDMSYVVTKLPDRAIWSAYLYAARRSSVGLRVEMIHSMAFGGGGQSNRDLRLAFVSAFLDDPAERRIPKEKGKFEGPCAAFTIPRLEVRDLAAMDAAYMLGIGAVPNESWTKTQWHDLRRKVRARLDGEKLPDLQGRATAHPTPGTTPKAK